MEYNSILHLIIKFVHKIYNNSINNQNIKEEYKQKEKIYIIKF